MADLTLTFEHWVPTGYDIRLRTVDPKGVHVQYTSSSVNAIGYGTGELAIYDVPDGTMIQGDFTVNSCVVNLGDRQREEPSSEKRKPAGLLVDLRLTTGKRVEFLWPSTTIPILRAYADTEQLLSIRYEDISGALEVTGTIDVQGGEIFYFKRNFYLKEGTIEFNEYEDKFDPVLSARAEIREVTDEGEQVKIFLVVENDPLSQFSPVFEAEPFLTDNEIFSILGTAIYTELGGADISVSSAAALAGDIVSQLSVIRTFEQRVKEIFNLDLFSVRTEIIQTLIREKIFNEIPDIQNPEYTSLGRYLDNTTVFLGRYFGNDIFLEAMFRINANTRLMTGYKHTDDLSIDSELSLEWKTPLFLLDVTYAPDIGNLRETYLDFSLGLSWGYSF